METMVILATIFIGLIALFILSCYFYKIEYDKAMEEVNRNEQ